MFRMEGQPQIFFSTEEGLLGREKVGRGRWTGNPFAAIRWGPDRKSLPVRPLATCQHEAGREPPRDEAGTEQREAEGLIEHCTGTALASPPCRSRRAGVRACTVTPLGCSLSLALLDPSWTLRPVNKYLPSPASVLVPPPLPSASLTSFTLLNFNLQLLLYPLRPPTPPQSWFVPVPAAPACLTVPQANVSNYTNVGSSTPHRGQC
jgi:hypothetical protein